jgi:hypothetical protein
MTVVVGVSPTTGSPAALRWAADEAQRRKVPLRSVLAWREPRPSAAPGGRPPASAGPGPDTDLAGDAERTLREFVRTALGNDDGVECVAVKGGAVNALLSAADGAELLVVGEPRRGRIASAKVARLVAPQVVLRAPCPVVVMPAAVAAAR